MHLQRRFDGLRKTGAIVCATVVLYLLWGCQTLTPSGSAGEADPRLMAKASLPAHLPGEYYVYDDGTSTLVTEVVDGLVAWRHHNGATSKGYSNFIIPDLAWSSAEHSSEGRTSAPADLLWPLTAGRLERFTFEQTITPLDGTPPYRVTRNWTCRVEGTTSVTVPARRFDTIVIACDRDADTRGLPGITRRFFYAPEVGHYVLREDRVLGLPKARRALTAYGFNSTLLPRQDQDALTRTLQTALTKNRDGRAAYWTSRSGEIAALLVPLRSFTAPDGRTCREYRSTYSVMGRIGQHTREVCRHPDGRWQRIN
jgi:hypothetical protein